MLDIKIRIKNKIGSEEESFSFPEGFKELTIEQWTAYYQFLHDDINTAELLWVFLHGKNEFKVKIPGSRISELENLLQFLYSEPAPEWYMKYLKINETELIGPAAEFSNLTIGEFVFADTYYTSFVKNMDEKNMNKCLAVLMREPNFDSDENSLNWNGDKRICFNENHIERRAALIACLPIEMRMAAMFNYGIIRDLIEKRYIWVFQKSEAEESKNVSGWDKVIRSMCFGDITKLNDISIIPLYTFLDELNDVIKENSKK